ncbi:MAG: leucine-rich repeat protein [Lachnospiraceae bacterium]|nr:leucine-rich repeat protein [Lachnospiraceae bacterium]
MKKKTGILLALCLVLLGVLFVNPKGVSAANGPCKDAESYAYIQTEGKVVGVDEWGFEDKINNYIYMSDHVKKNNDEYGSSYTTNIPKGISYNEKTNTLTLNNYTGKEISCNMMGDDFKLELKGENTLEMLYIWSDYYGGSVTITGDGVLNVKGGSDDRESLYGSSGIKLFVESLGASSFFKVTGNATVNVESSDSYNDILIGVYMTLEKKNGIILDGVKLSGGLLAKDTVQMETSVKRKPEGGLYDTYFSVIKKGGKQYLCQSNFDWSTGTSSVIVYSDADTPKEIARYADYDEVEAAGYEFLYYDVYDYRISGKHCTISAKADTSLKKDDVVVVDNLVYGIKTVGTKKKAGTVYVAGIDDFDKEKATVTIPKTVKIDGISYKVTGIGKYAFNYDSKMEKVVIGANVKYIEEQAFYYASELKDIVIKSKKLTSKTVGKDAFGEIGKKVTVAAPSKKLSSYKKTLTAKGLSKDTVFKKG